MYPPDAAISPANDNNTALVDAMNQENELHENDIIALDHVAKAGIQKHYKNKKTQQAGRKTDLI